MPSEPASAPGPPPRYSAEPQGIWCPRCGIFNPAAYSRCVKCHKPLVKRVSPLLIAAFSLLFVLILAGLGRLLTGNRGAPDVETFLFPAPAAPPDQPAAKVSIRRFAWRKSESGDAMVAFFSIRNNNPYPVDGIRVECQVSEKRGPSVAYLEETLREAIQPDSARNFEDVAMGRIEKWATRAGCRVKSAEKAL